MAQPISKGRRRRAAEKTRKRDAEDTLSTPDGTAIPIWQSGAGDPVAHLADVFDQLPGRSRSLTSR
ncbi:hypothetical protein ABIE44_002220 [Marmoricola sp. OAE513]|uniref:hypothetical protein n=1 Tax=Marmoricola sp. OAE513 TaxID=2817894 RepID=UPI001AE498A6